jgi:hypothetical protein
VREKLEQFQEDTGGFGTLLVFACDYGAQPEAWRDSLRLLAEEVVTKMSPQAVEA